MIGLSICAGVDQSILYGGPRYQYAGGCGEGDEQFYSAKVATAKFYASHVLPGTAALRHAIIEGSDDVMALAVDDF